MRQQVRNRLRGMSLLAFGATLSSAAAAQSTAAADGTRPEEPRPEPSVLAPVIVTGRQEDGFTVDATSSATKLSLSPRETPQSLTVMTRERMDQQNLNSVRQVLDNTPGVYSNAYDTERVLFYSRGFLIDSLMYDGVPASANFNTGSIDETLDTAPYERIEIVRGATGLMTGTGNPAASINLVRKHADSRSPTIGVDLSYGSWSDRRAVVDGQAPLSADGRVRARARARARFVGVAEDTESYQAFYHKRTYVGYGIVDADLGPKTRLSLGFDYQNNLPRSNTWGSFPLFLWNAQTGQGQDADWPRSVTTATDWSYWNRSTQTAFAELNQAFDNDWLLRASASHRRYQEGYKLFYVYGFPDSVTGEGLDPYAYGGDGTIAENALDVYASGPFQLGGRVHELVVGYNGSRAKNTGTEYSPLGTLPPVGDFFQWNGSYPKPAFGPGTLAQDISTDQDAVYAAARFSLADRAKLIAGARYARWNVDSYYIYESSASSSNHYGFSRVVPYAGLVWDVLPEYSAFASYTGIFKPQTALGADGRYLPPVDGRSYEVGIKGEHFERRLTTALTLFETRQDNIAAPLLDPVTGEPVYFPDGITPVSQAIDGVRTRGFEIEVVGRLTNDVQLSFGWTHYLMDDQAGEAVRTFIPNTQVTLFATWQPRQWAENLTLGVGVNWQSATSTIVGFPVGSQFDAVPTRFDQGAFANVSLMAEYRFTPRIALQFNAENVFDKRYFVLDQYDNTFYGAPASATLTLRMAY